MSLQPHLYVYTCTYRVLWNDLAMHEIRFTLACLHARPLPLYVEICEQGSGNEARLLCDWVVPSYDYADSHVTTV